MVAIALWIRNFEVDGEEVSALAQRLQWWTLLPIFALLSLHVALASWRWSLIETAVGGLPGPRSHAFGFGAIALALGTFLPPPIIYVACRGLTNRVNGTNPIRGAISGAIDQGADFALVSMMAFPAFVALWMKDLTIFALGALAMALIGFSALLILPQLRWVAELLRRGRLGGLGRREILLKIYGLSLMRMVNLVAITLMIGVACSVESIEAIIIGVPLVTLAISIAMLPGAIGVSEWSFSAVFAAFALPDADIVTFVLANRLILTSCGIVLGAAVVIVLALQYRIRSLSEN